MSVPAALFLFAGVAVEIACCLGLLLSRNVYARIHFMGPATIVAPVCIAVAVLIAEGLGQASIKAMIIALILIVTSPILSHATARMAYAAERDREHLRKSGDKKRRRKDGS